VGQDQNDRIICICRARCREKRRTAPSDEDKTMAERVVLAMSGGVDSSASALLLQRQGYEVIGLFMRTGVSADGQVAARSERKRGCCSAIDAGDARRVADRLDIPFYALDFEEEFGRVIDYFADEYLAGRTPNPCVVCNTWLKFGRLWEFARGLGAERIATGHYARIGCTVHGEPTLLRGADAGKDQSYVLYGIARDLLPRLLFPIGDLPKPAVRELAREAGLAVADKPDSVEICFVPDGDHASLVRRRRPGMATAGAIVDTAGRHVADHDGFERFTVGQRKGLGISGGAKRYVLAIVPATQEVVVGDREELLATGLEASRVNWLCEPPTEPLRCQAKIRYRHEPADVVVHASAEGGALLRFDAAQAAITPGQAVVLYDGERVLGGGWIERAIA
jgi:tRNA-specific 2-thiouridylase